ncbi:DNA-binding protein, partial [Escherichia coli]|nr:DNA-binding protein [Escherichia coli]
MHLEKMTRKEAAEHLGVSVQTLANWACTGKV